MTRLLFLLFSVQSFFAFSQAKKTPDVFEDAYVVTLKGDTLKGQIKIPAVKKLELYQKISFKDKTNKVKPFLPDRIKGYGYKNYFYMTAFHNNKSCFFKVLSAGKISLFVTKFEVFDEGEAREVHEYCYMLENGDGQFKILESKGLKKQLKDIFKSNKDLVQKINDQKEIVLNEETIELYFKEFNQ